MRVLTVVGNRPQFVKAAAVCAPLRERHTEILVHTGQHYDPELSEVFFSELDLPVPEHRLAVGAGSPTRQTAAMLAGLEALLAEARPDVALVYGDTTSTLAGALAAAQARVPVAHVEAGMRSFDRAMPEELNRVMADHVSELLLCASHTAAANLRAEGIPAAATVVVGDVMVDVFHRLAPHARQRRDVPERLGLRVGGYLLATAHRAGTVDDPARLAGLVGLLEDLGAPVVVALHPRTRARLEAEGLLGRLCAAPGVRVIAPVGYRDFLALLVHACALVTDSGGAQKEAYLAGVPCVTLRARTEWVETVRAGWNVCVDLDVAAARAALHRPPPAERPALYGDGHAGHRVVGALEDAFAAPVAPGRG